MGKKPRELTDSEQNHYMVSIEETHMQRLRTRSRFGLNLVLSQFQLCTSHKHVSQFIHIHSMGYLPIYPLCGHGSVGFQIRFPDDPTPCLDLASVICCPDGPLLLTNFPFTLGLDDSTFMLDVDMHSACPSATPWSTCPIRCHPCGSLLGQNPFPPPSL